MHPLPAEEAAARRACARLGFPASWAGTVAARLADPHDAWRVCCGSACDPCTEQLGRAVDLARHELRRHAAGWLPDQDSNLD